MATRVPIVTLLLAVACSARQPGGGGSDGGDDGTPPLEAGPDTPVDGSPPVDAPADRAPDAPPDDDVVVWAHSADTLFSFDPRTNTVRRIGDFWQAGGSPPPGMTDLAVNAAGEIYTCTGLGLWRVDPETAEVAQQALFFGGSGFNAMTFLPAGVLDAGEETLIGAGGSAYSRIDLDTGEVTPLGTYSGGYFSSGDLVSVEGAGTFATVGDDDDATDGDVLVRLEPTTGTATRIGWGIGFRQLFGLGYWRNRLFGFSNDGELVEIDIATGEGTLVTAATGTGSFWGAGVTTTAPVGPW